MKLGKSIRTAFKRAVAGALMAAASLATPALAQDTDGVTPAMPSSMTQGAIQTVDIPASQPVIAVSREDKKAQFINTMMTALKTRTPEAIDAVQTLLGVEKTGRFDTATSNKMLAVAHEYGNAVSAQLIEALIDTAPKQQAPVVSSTHKTTSAATSSIVHHASLSGDKLLELYKNAKAADASRTDIRAYQKALGMPKRYQTGIFANITQRYSDKAFKDRGMTVPEVQMAVQDAPPPITSVQPTVAFSRHARLVGADLFYKVGTGKTTTTSDYGWRLRKRGGPNRRVHMAYDEAGAGAVTLRQPEGEVVQAKWDSNGGNGVYVAVPSQCVVTASYHHPRQIVRVGQKLSEGDKIGYVGMTGDADGPHAHIETWVMSHTALTGSAQFYAPNPRIVAEMIQNGKSMCDERNANEAISRTAWKSAVVPLAQRRPNVTGYSMEQLRTKMGLGPDGAAYRAAFAADRSGMGDASDYVAPKPVVYTPRQPNVSNIDNTVNSAVELMSNPQQQRAGALTVSFQEQADKTPQLIATTAALDALRGQFSVNKYAGLSLR